MSDKSPKSPIVVVDGGGSSCRAAACDVAGSVLARVEIKAHASLTLGVEEAWQHIQQSFSQLADRLNIRGDWQPDVLYMGLAGSMQTDQRQRFLKQIPAPIQVTLVTDGMAQLIGASGDKPGICVSIGTGSVLHWQDEQGVTGMAGGWGFPAGDEGSGAWLGFKLLQRYLWHRDGQTSNSPLMQIAESVVGCSVSDIQQWTSQARSTQLAELARPVIDHLGSGDSLAIELVEEGTQCILRLVTIAPEHLPVFVVGGLADGYKEYLARQLGDRMVTAQGDALSGLYQLHKRLDTPLA
ncbi:MAG: BadF/BadG/BcrA/BcrD ATPase family protein [Granulosicoccus sp.]